MSMTFSELASQHTSTDASLPGPARPNSAYEHLLSRFRGHPVEASFRSLVGTLPADDYTHGLYPYPARLVRHIPRLLLASEKLTENIEHVVDPFCGSGTISLEAKLRGLRSTGIDQNPIATLVTRAKTSEVDTQAVASLADQILDNAKRTREKYQAPSFLRHWYQPAPYSALQRLATLVNNLEESSITDPLRLTLALTARRVASTDKQIPVPIRPRKGFVHTTTSRDVWRIWQIELERILVKISRVANLTGKNSTITGDSRYPETWRMVDTSKPFMVMTSPPYGAAQKYIRGTSLESGWLGYTNGSGPRSLEKSSIGREHLGPEDGNEPLPGNTEGYLTAVLEKNPLRERIYRTYFSEMSQAFSAFAGNPACQKIVLVAATNMVSGVEIPTYRLLGDLIIDHGFETKIIIKDPIRSRSMLTKRHRGSAPTQHEYVMVFERP